MTTQLDMIRGRSNVVTLTNNSGGGLVAGDVCVQDTSADEKVTTTTSAASVLKVFIAAETIASGAAGKFYESGFCPLVNVNASVTRGRFLFTHTVAKQAAENATYGAGAFGKILKSGTTPSAIIYSATAQVSGAGTIGGSTGATDNAVIRADGTGGVTVQNSLMTVDDSGTPNIPTGQTYNINNTPHTHAGNTTFNGNLIGGLTTPPSGGWTWVNQGGATLTDNTTYQYLYMASGTAGNNVRAVVRSATPTTRLSAVLNPLLPWAANYNAGILVRNSTSGKMYTLSITYAAQQLSVDHWSSATAWAGNDGAINLYGWALAQPFYLGCKVDGTNIDFQSSLIGDNTDAHWQSIKQIALASYITSIDQFGIFVYLDANAQSVGCALLHWNIY